MNKAVAATLTAAMLLSMGTTTAFAETGKITGNSVNTAQTASVTVKYQVDSTYTWSIHSDIDFGTSGASGQTNTKTGNEVKVSDCIIPNGNKVQIKLAGSYGSNSTEQGFKIWTAQGATRDYTVTKQDDANSTVGSNGVVLEVASGTKESSVKLTYTLQGIASGTTSEQAGSYTGTATYTAQVVQDSQD